MRPTGDWVRVSPGFCLLALWFASASGWRPLLALLCAAAVHEGGHLLALRACGAEVTGFRLELTGAVLETDCGRLSYGRELLCVLAGPAANLLCARALAGGPWPGLTGANLVLCACNLLPVRPLDGGRALELAVSWAAGPSAGDRAADAVGTAGMVLVVLLTGYLVWRSGGSLWLLPAAGGLAASFLRTRTAPARVSPARRRL